MSELAARPDGALPAVDDLKLVVDEGTVQAHVSRIFMKAGPSRSHAGIGNDLPWPIDGLGAEVVYFAKASRPLDKANPRLRLTPEQVRFAELIGPPDDLNLFPEEENAVADAIQKRRQEFAAVRQCARGALSRLGHRAGPILPGDGGAPIWPEGVVGSMTHCPDYAAAAVARSSDVVALGIDAEPDEPLPVGALGLIALPDEEIQIGDLLTKRPDLCWDRLLFSAKESVYKTWFPLTGAWLDYDQAHVTVDPDAGTFSARLLVPSPPLNGTQLLGFDGRWIRFEGILLTAIALSR